LAETESAHFLVVLNHALAGASTNKWLRIVHSRHPGGVSDLVVGLLCGVHGSGGIEGRVSG
jgi:hypothetical protein